MSSSDLSKPTRLSGSLTFGQPRDSNPHKPDKGLMNGSCNRTACQAPLAHEPVHQFMDGNFTGRGRLFYCRACSWEFDKWDRIDRPGEPMRIEREPKSAVSESTVGSDPTVCQPILSSDAQSVRPDGGGG